LNPEQVGVYCSAHLHAVQFVKLFQGVLYGSNSSLGQPRKFDSGRPWPLLESGKDVLFVE
jgi:hypothetical protein